MRISTFFIKESSCACWYLEITSKCIDICNFLMSMTIADVVVVERRGRAVDIELAIATVDVELAIAAVDVESVESVVADVDVDVDVDVESITVAVDVVDVLFRVGDDHLD